MFTEKDVLIGQECQRDLLRRSQHERLIYQAVGKGQISLFSRITVWLRDYLAAWKTRLWKRMGTDTYNRSIALAFADGINTGNLKKAAEYMGEEFQSKGLTHQTLNADEWLGVMEALRVAFPNVQHNMCVLTVEGNTVAFTTQVSGTHTAKLDLAFLGLHTIPRTNTSFSCSTEKGRMVIEGDKVVSAFIQVAEEPILTRILQQVGPVLSVR